jgi:hypothetical protein
MTLTHHPVRLFRLSCGCLREYPMMPAGTVHVVLCAYCRAEAKTVLAYPEKACGAYGWVTRAGTRLRVSCTLGTGQCTGLFHIDTCAGLAFTADGPRLQTRRDGRTGRA